MVQDFGLILLVSENEVMIRGDNWGHLYFTVRGETLGFTKDKQLQKHLPGVFSLIKSKS